MIPAQAVEAAARRLCVLAGYDWDNVDAPEDVVADFKTQLTAQAKSILEAAAPHMLVLVKANADELAAEYRRGYRDGLVDRKQVTADQREWQPGDPIE